jgi:gas vesicle protein
VGPFLLGIGLGVALGFLFAPDAGDITRRRLGRQVSKLKDAATDKVEELRDLAGEMLEGGDSDREPEVDPTPREQLERKLAAARRRRRELKAGGQGSVVAEADEPDA